MSRLGLVAPRRWELISPSVPGAWNIVVALEDNAGRQRHAEKAEAGVLKAEHAGADRAWMKAEARHKQYHAYSVGQLIAQTRYAVGDASG
ncbi:hypothetical protein NAV33_20070 [Pseudomonas stutzeri]|uniref:hypothetical protein n=1 Tax=Stutzerimonas stutzeri TaxID=316 RepID=UPI002108AC95|nr:hypothetical protein [Stutzerimonas stutzeri]MCQ4314170.1 hypothetical protein [Stutzerimonas stutzeri]